MNRMRWTLMLMLLAAFPAAAWAQADAKPAMQGAQAPAAPSVGRVLSNQLRNAESELVSAAEAMPDDKFTFAPTSGEFKGVRNFGEQLRHVAASNYLFYAHIAGEKPPVDVGQGESGPESMKTKPDIVKYLKGSFEYGHKVLNAFPSEKWTSQIKSPFGQGTMTPLGLAILTHGHVFDHYGQVVEYLRMNGIIPPASRPQPR